MGLFSWNCKSCGHPLLSQDATDEDGTNKWMKDGVAILPGGSVVMGEYNGYGKLNNVNIYESEASEPECYHKACWEKAGKPTDYTDGSDSSHDQGWFFSDGDHSIPEPKVDIDKTFKRIELPCWGIAVEVDENNPSNGAIYSNLTHLGDSEYHENPNGEYDAAVDAILSMILCHACSGIDIKTPAYIEGIETAVNGIGS